mgnify:FL=1|jgi:hypothetical protein
METKRRVRGKITYMWSDGVIDHIARKVAEEPMEDVPQHVIDEDRGDRLRQLRKEQAQMEMYDDPYLNWSGHR